MGLFAWDRYDIPSALTILYTCGLPCVYPRTRMSMTCVYSHWNLVQPFVLGLLHNSFSIVSGDDWFISAKHAVSCDVL